MLQASQEAIKTVARAAVKAPKQVKGALNRPNNTTAYAAGEVIFGNAPTGNQPKALLLPEAVTSNGGAGYIVSATLLDLAAQGTRLAADLLLFTEAPGTAFVDNDPFAPDAAYMEKFVGMVSFPANGAKDVGSYSLYSVAVNQAFVTKDDSKDLYGVLLARNAYTPIANERIIVQLNIVGRGMALL